MQVVEGTRLGGYRVVRKIGEGGMGAVFEGVHERLQKRVAIKTLHEQFARDAGAVARFTREGRAASRIQHSHVIDVTDVGMENGQPYLVMELLDGESLASLVKRVGPLGPDAIADIALPVCDALDAAHAAGIVHRDLKPENIFLTRSRSGTDAHPMVLDFGISCIEDEVRMTKTAHFMGTPHYMSPEQAQSARSVDGRSDQFSLGLVLFELVTGRRALNGDSVLEVVHRVSTEGAIRLTLVRPDLPRAFTAVIDRMTERDPAMRYPSMRAVGAALLPFASPRGNAMWGHAFQNAGSMVSSALRSSIPIPEARPSATPSFSSHSPSIPVSVPSSFSTQDAPPRASFSSAGAMPSTRPAPMNGGSLPGQPHPVLTPSFSPRSSAVGSRMATDPTVDAGQSPRHSRASESTPPPPASSRSPILLGIIAFACVLGAVGVAFVVGTTLAHQQQALATTGLATTAIAPPPPSAATPPTDVPVPTASTTPLEVRVRAVPATASIVLDGATVGTGSYSGSVAHDGIPHLLEVRADGFVPHDIQFLDIAPVATITLEAVPRHHHGPIVAQHSQMTPTGLVETSAAPPPPQPRTTQGLAAPTTEIALAPPTTATETFVPTAGSTTPSMPHAQGQGQVPGSGAGSGTAAPIPTTTVAEPTPPPPTTTPPPPTTTTPAHGDDWATDDSDGLVPFQ